MSPDIPDDPFAQIRVWADRIRCAEIAREEARRTVLAPDPATAVKLEALAVALGVDDLMTVRVSPFLPPDTIVVIDEQSIDAGHREAVQHWRPTFIPERACPRCAFPVGTGHSLSCPAQIMIAGMSVLDPSAFLRVTGA